MTEPEVDIEVVEPQAEESGEPRLPSFMEDTNLLRTAGALVLLAIVLVSLVVIFVDYRARVVRDTPAPRAKKTVVTAAKPSKPASSSVAATATAKPVGGGTLVILIDGVNFRQQPSGSARILRTLNKGTKLTFIEQSGSWYHGATPDGVRGWLTNSSQYVKRQ